MPSVWKASQERKAARKAKANKAKGAGKTAPSYPSGTNNVSLGKGFRSSGTSQVGSTTVTHGSTAPKAAAKPKTESFGSAFKAARSAHGGAGGTFKWQGKSFHTGHKGEGTPSMPKVTAESKSVGTPKAKTTPGTVTAKPSATNTPKVPATKIASSGNNASAKAQAAKAATTRTPVNDPGMSFAKPNLNVVGLTAALGTAAAGFGSAFASKRVKPLAGKPSNGLPSGQVPLRLGTGQKRLGTGQLRIGGGPDMDLPVRKPSDLPVRRVVGGLAISQGAIAPRASGEVASVSTPKTIEAPAPTNSSSSAKKVTSRRSQADPASVEGNRKRRPMKPRKAKAKKVKTNSSAVAAQATPAPATPAVPKAPEVTAGAENKTVVPEVETQPTASKPPKKKVRTRKKKSTPAKVETPETANAAPAAPPARSPETQARIDRQVANATPTPRPQGPTEAPEGLRPTGRRGSRPTGTSTETERIQLQKAAREYGQTKAAERAGAVGTPTPSAPSTPETGNDGKPKVRLRDLGQAIEDKKSSAPAPSRPSTANLRAQIAELQKANAGIRSRVGDTPAPTPTAPAAPNVARAETESMVASARDTLAKERARGSHPVLDAVEAELDKVDKGVREAARAHRQPAAPAAPARPSKPSKAELIKEASAGGVPEGGSIGDETTKSRIARSKQRSTVSSEISGVTDPKELGSTGQTQAQKNAARRAAIDKHVAAKGALVGDTEGNSLRVTGKQYSGLRDMSSTARQAARRAANIARRGVGPAAVATGALLGANAAQASGGGSKEVAKGASKGAAEVGLMGAAFTGLAKIAPKVVSKVFLPATVAQTAVDVGTSIYEGVGAYKAYQHQKKTEAASKAFQEKAKKKMSAIRSNRNSA